MFEVVKNWGVWLETVEITDVVISSGSLFKDLQAEFRENMKKESELYKMVVQSEIDEIKVKQNLIMQEKRDKANIEKKIYEKKIDEEIAEEAEKQLAQIAIINNEKLKMQNEQQNFKKEAEAEFENKLIEL